MFAILVYGTLSPYLIFLPCPHRQPLDWPSLPTGPAPPPPPAHARGCSSPSTACSCPSRHRGALRVGVCLMRPQRSHIHGTTRYRPSAASIKERQLGVFTSQKIHGLCYRRPIARVMVRAPEAHEEHSPHLQAIKLALQPPICLPKNGVLAVHVPDPIRPCSFPSDRAGMRPGPIRPFQPKNDPISFPTEGYREQNPISVGGSRRLLAAAHGGGLQAACGQALGGARRVASRRGGLQVARRGGIQAAHIGGLQAVRRDEHRFFFMANLLLFSPSPTDLTLEFLVDPFKQQAMAWRCQAGEANRGGGSTARRQDEASATVAPSPTTTRFSAPFSPQSSRADRAPAGVDPRTLADGRPNDHLTRRRTHCSPQPPRQALTLASWRLGGDARWRSALRRTHRPKRFHNGLASNIKTYDALCARQATPHAIHGGSARGEDHGESQEARPRETANNIYPRAQQLGRREPELGCSRAAAMAEVRQGGERRSQPEEPPKHLPRSRNNTAARSSLGQTNCNSTNMKKGPYPGETATRSCKTERRGLWSDREETRASGNERGDDGGAFGGEKQGGEGRMTARERRLAGGHGGEQRSGAVKRGEGETINGALTAVRCCCCLPPPAAPLTELSPSGLDAWPANRPSAAAGRCQL
ncbi:hypothetical protein HU200_000612 [Digitaria exilis]|uniref:Uncharacterized protein n=1 Tax=Digitaria exilis TaxID=1010633 RepID=A0A835FZV3_9POAL|nr:hypothetical protein HU200_000612 [Digitaria exilis]